MSTLDELTSLTLEYIKKHWNTGGTSEFDHSINEISRAKIQVFYSHHGQAWLFKINRFFEEDKDKPYLVEYTGQQVYNFEFDGIVPCNDATLIELLKDYESPMQVYNGKDIMKKIDAIMNRMHELKGINLIWS